MQPKRCTLLAIFFLSIAKISLAQEPHGFEKALCIENDTEGTQKVSISVSGPTGDQAFFVDWSPEWFTASPFLYNHSLCRTLAVLSETSYWEHCVEPAFIALGVPVENIAMHYELDYADEIFGYDQCAVTFAHFFTSDGSPVIIILVRGTPTGKEEWISNANIANAISKSAPHPKETPSREHEGFSKAERLVERELYRYMRTHQFDIQTVRFVITGHSRGAAVANLLAARFVKEKNIPPEHIFAYTFACPNVTQETDVYEDTFDFIWNIVNEEDMIASVPMANAGWGYRKYGRVLGLVNAFTAPSYRTFTESYIPKMNEHFSRVLGRPYRPFNTANLFPYLFSVALPSLKKDVVHFYNDSISLHDLFVKLLDDTEGLSVQNESWLGTQVKKHIEKDRPHFFENLGEAMNDMHICVNYFSWLLALSKEEAFCTNNSYIVAFQGNADVLFSCKNSFDDSKPPLVETIHIFNGVPESSYTTESVKLIHLPNGKVIAALPSNRPFHIELSSQSLLDTSVSVTVYTYTSAGYCKKAESCPSVKVNSATLYTLDVTDGNISLADAQKVCGTMARNTSWKNAEHSFSVRPELFFNSALELGLGIQIGWPHIYGLCEAGTNELFTYSMTHFAAGVGIKTQLAGPFFVGTLAKWKAVQDSSSPKGKKWTQWQHAALTFSYRPQKRFEITADFGADVYIPAFNTAAVSSQLRPYSQHTEKQGASHVGVYPLIEIGFLF